MFNKKVTYNGNDNPEIAFQLIIGLLKNAGGELDMDGDAARWVTEMARRGTHLGYMTTGHADSVTLHLVSPEHPWAEIRRESARDRVAKRSGPQAAGHDEEPTEDQLNYLSQLMEMESMGERTTIHVGPYTAMLMIGALQLATRQMEGAPRKALRGVVDQFRPLFTGTVGEEIVNRGDHPEWDK